MLRRIIGAFKIARPTLSLKRFRRFRGLRQCGSGSDRGVRKGFPEVRIQLHGGQLRGVIG